MAKLLVVDDDDSLVSMLNLNLKQEGYTLDVAYNRSFAVEMIRDNTFDLFIFDVDLPDGSGFELCEHLRSTGSQRPVIMLTGHHEVEAKEKAFGCGADDYLTKPFNYRELSVRLKALLRRAPTISTSTVQLGAVTIDLVARTVTRGGEAIHLQRLDFNLLEFFIKHPNVALPQERILTSVWKSYTESGTDALRSAVKRIRREIDSPGQASHIETVYGVGYLFRQECE